MTDSGTAKTERIKVIIRLHDNSIVRAFLKPEAAWDSNALTVNLGSFRMGSNVYCIGEDGRAINFEWTNVKAVFFVSSFEGDHEQRSVRLYGQGPSVESIWVEVVFRDGEIIEGCVENSLFHLRDDGFFLLPSSPYSNNRSVYVNKQAIASYRVLGVRVKENTLNPL